MLQHQELNTLEEDETRNEMKRRNQLREIKEDHEKLLRLITEEGLPIEFNDIETSVTLNPILVNKNVMDGQKIYERRIRRGKIVSNMLEKHNVREESLSKINRECLKHYIKLMSQYNLCEN